MPFPKANRARRAPRPLDRARLNELALRYVGRFATTRAKLRVYLARKLKERGWEGEGEPDVAALAERFAGLGYIDDAAFALSKAGALAARGLGKRRLSETLRSAGVEEDDRREAYDHADDEAVAAALRFARRKRLGPFASDGEQSPAERQKAIAAMVRAGHGFALVKEVLSLRVGMSQESAEDALKNPHTGR